MSDASLLDLAGEESETRRGWSRGTSSRRRRRFDTGATDAAPDVGPRLPDRGAFRLVALDGLSIASGWLLGSLLFGSPLAHPDAQLRLVFAVVVVLGLSLAGNYTWALYAEGTADRALEFRACARSCFIGATFVALLSARLNLQVPLPSVAASGIFSLLLLVIS